MGEQGGRSAIGDKLDGCARERGDEACVWARAVRGANFNFFRIVTLPFKSADLATAHDNELTGV